MARKSDKRPKRISATEASRSFSKMLDEVASGRRYLIHRRGRDICAMGPPVMAGSSWGPSPVVPVTLEVARVFGALDARLSAHGRRLPTSDVLIASTALTPSDSVVTGNQRHFDRVPGLKVHVLGMMGHGE